MSGERAPILGAKASERARTSSRNRWFATLARGGAVAATACAIVGATIFAAGHVLALAIDARSDTRSLVGLSRPGGGLAWFSEPDDTMIPLMETAAFSLNAGTLAALGSRLELAAAAAGSLSDDDLIFTGSIGNTGGSFSIPPAEPALRLENPAQPNNERLPLPRMRPRLAALTPPDLGVPPDENPQLAKTAVYDITARTVYMPDGEKLEAHSGFGEHMDNPRYVRLRMRGVTPPNTYKLTMREALFHGVEAIRMTPDNKAAMFGRDGILVHPYLLGPNGQSNGCVSIKDYPKFLAAFKRGEVDRMIVVFRLDKPPSFFAKDDSTRAAKLPQLERASWRHQPG